MIKPITQYQTEDGAVFPTEPQARCHAVFLKVKEAIESSADAIDRKYVGRDDRDNDVIYMDEIGRFIASNADLLREIFDCVYGPGDPQ